MENKDNFPRSLKYEKFNLSKEFKKYLVYWPWFLFSLLLFLSLGYLHLKFSPPLYSAKASIIIKDKSSGSGVGAAIYSELGIEGMAANDFDTELGILRSKYLMEEVVKSLNLQIQYFRKGKFRTEELYEELPFNLQIFRLSDSHLREIGGASFEVIEGTSGFILKNSADETILRVPSGKPIDLGFGDMVFTSSGVSQYGEPKPIIVTFSSIENTAAQYRGGVQLSQESKASGLINLEIQDPVKEKARDILDQLIIEYNRDAIEDRNLVAGNTANFINERLAIINGELDSVETGKENFKESNLLTDIGAQSQLFIQNANDYNKERQEVGTQMELAKAMLDYITSNSKSELLPTNLGISESGVNQQIGEYNNLVLERNRILAGSSVKNPMVIRLDNNVEQIKNNIVQSLKNMYSNLEINQDELNRKASSIGSQIYAVPSKERKYRGIERQQNIKETLYLFLLQKREENSLSLAVTEPRAKIVDRAYFTNYPVGPNSRNIYLGTFVLGLFLPFSVIYVKEMLNDKVKNKGDIEKETRDIPLAGVIPKIKLREKCLIGNNDRSVLAESFRILTTNLQYFLVNSKNKSGGLVLSVTSTTKGEGKTFIAVNLAITLANSGKKVLLLGADLRNPKLSRYVANNDSVLGLSDYLLNDNLRVQLLIGPSNLHEKIDIFSAGTIPPNPFELLKQPKLGELYRELEDRYDYIIVDTAPSMLVADTFLISKYADATLYLVRADYTDKDLLQFPIDSKEEGKISNICFVLNAVKQENLTYGSKYGYGYGPEKKGFLTEIFSFPEFR